MTEHIPAEALRDYVMGSLEAEYRARLEAHAVECEGCSQRLRQEAQLELAMYAVAREAERPDRCPAADYAACWRNAIVAAVSCASSTRALSGIIAPSKRTRA